MGWIFLAMAAFGLLVGLLFPLLVSGLVVERPDRLIAFRVASLIAGLLVGMFGYSVVWFTLYRSNKRLVHIASHDALTGLMNQREFPRILGRELGRAARLDHPVTLLIGDLDHFKAVNDRFGHLVGDRVLASLGEVLLKQLRPYDAACRIGGEEFAIILPHTDCADGERAAERIRRSIAEQSTEGLPPVTVSLGVACYPAEADNADLLIKRADDAMYRAKAAGRNVTRRWQDCDKETSPPSCSSPQSVEG